MAWFKDFYSLVDRPGFEPGSSRVQTERSSRLSYRPIIYILSNPFNFCWAKMGIYWMRCDWCGSYNIVKPCYLHPLENICYISCITCRERPQCPNPAWSPWARPGGYSIARQTQQQAPGTQARQQRTTSTQTSRSRVQQK